MFTVTPYGGSGKFIIALPERGMGKGHRPTKVIAETLEEAHEAMNHYFGHTTHFTVAPRSACPLCRLVEAETQKFRNCKKGA